MILGYSRILNPFLSATLSPCKTFLSTRRTLVAARNEAILSPWTSSLSSVFQVPNNTRPMPTVVTISVERLRVETTLQPSEAWIMKSDCERVRLYAFKLKARRYELRKIGRVFREDFKEKMHSIASNVNVSLLSVFLCQPIKSWR